MPYQGITYEQSTLYSYGVTARLGRAEPLESFRRTFHVYHQALLYRLSPRLNLHMLYDAGFLDFMPLELKEAIMDKIDVGHLRYRPGQLQEIGLHALGL